MPPPSFRPDRKPMTAQPVKLERQWASKTQVAGINSRYRSDSESESEAEKPAVKPKRLPPPKSKFTAVLARQKEDEERKKLEEGFETESEEESGGSGESGSDSGGESGSGSDAESSEEEESDEDEAPRKPIRPMYMKKGQRDKILSNGKSQDDVAAEEEARRQQDAKALVQAELERAAEERAAGNKEWDQDAEVADIDAIDDTDGLDPEAEHASWKLREFKRVKRAREEIEAREAELAEKERWDNLTQTEKEAELKARQEKQDEERGEKGDIAYMQKYFHKGAFYTEDLEKLGVDRRNVMGAHFEDATNREVLPDYMKIRDMTKLGKKGRTRYKDMKSEDTGRWGDYNDRRKPRDDYGVDERFRSDNYNGSRDGGREGATGANAGPLGERKRPADDSSRDSKRTRYDD